MQRNSKYMAFYFEGRDEELDQDDLDIEQLAKDALGSVNESPHQIALRAVTKLAVPLADGRERREWIVDYKDELDKAPDLDPNVAYEHFLQGRIEQTAAVIEDEMLTIMDPREDEEDDEDEDEEDDDDDGGGSDDEDDEDEHD